MNTKRIKAIIIEDEIYDKKLIEKVLISEFSEYVEILDSVDTIEKAVESINKNKPELLFLDIELNGDRHGAYKILQQVKNNFRIIFVTAKSGQDDLLKAIKLSCIDFLIKPTRISDFEAPLKKVFAEINNTKLENSEHKIDLFKHNVEVKNLQEAKISLQTGFTYIPTTIKDILRCEAEGNYTRIIFANDKNSCLVNGNLKSFEDRLSDSGFCRINKSDLINLSHIKTFSRKNQTWELVMADDKTIYISPQRKHGFLMKYNALHLS